MTDGSRSAADGAAPSPQELRLRVEDTREQLARTVEALAAKADAKALARQKAAGASQAVRRNPVPLIGAGVGAAVVAALVLAAGRRRRCGR
ncbi:DUF3618 domain-containing protein [Streptomyces daliensis]